MKFERKKIAVALACALGTGSAFLITAAPTQAADISVSVTGTNIRRVDSETPSPVQVITAEEMVQSGYTTISEVLRDITANGQGLLSQGFSRAFAGGASGVALRGLSVGSTLVLIDGYRMAAYPLADDAQRPFVDVSSIPFSAIERVEVLLDGASAVYGSDAIGGVVNVILKKSFTGTGLVVDGGSTTKGGGTTVHGSIMQGFGSPSEMANGFIALEYRHQDQVKLSQRSGNWTNFDWTKEGGEDLRPGATSATISTPFVRTPYLQRPGGNAQNPADSIFLDSNCDIPRRRANECVYKDTWSQVLPQTQNVNVLGSLSARFGSGWQGNLTGSWFNSESGNTVRQTSLPNPTITVTAIGVGQIPKLVRTTVTVPATYPGNTFGTVANVKAILPDIETRTTDFDTKTTRLVAQLNGPAWGWDVTAAAGYTKSKSDITYRGYIDPVALNAALNNPANPFKLTGGNSTDVLNLVTPTVHNHPSNETDFVQAVASRDLMKLDGGPLGFAMGAGWVYTDLQAASAPVVASGQVAGINAAYAVGDQTNTNVYFELNAPVLKSLELNAAVRYDHYDTYGGQWTPKVGAKWTPMKEVGLRATWGKGFRAPAPTENGDAGALFGFNAIRDPVLCPASLPSGKPDLKSPANVTTPNQCNFAPTYLQVSNPDVKAEKSTNWTAGLIVEPIAGWSTTADYYSIKIDDQIIPAASLSTYDPLAFAVRGQPQQVTFGDGRQGVSSTGLIQYSTVPFVNGQSVHTTGLDLQSSYTFKMDNANTFMVAVQWSHIFKYDLTLNGVTYKLAGTHGPQLISGNTGNPKDRLQGTLQWKSGPWTVTGIGNYVGSYDMTDPSLADLPCSDWINFNNDQRWVNVTAPSKYCKAGSFWYASLNVQYQVNKQLMVQGSVNNLFNNKPPVDMSSYAGTGLNLSSNETGAPYNPSLHGPGTLGPVWSLGLTYNF